MQASALVLPYPVSRCAGTAPASLNTLIVVGKAEGVAHTARITELAELQKAAWRPVRR